MGLRALITGITGQDGSYLAEFLLERGYTVFGLIRRSSVENYDRIAHLVDKISFLQADLLDQSSLINALRQAKAQEVYNLAAQSFVPTSWHQPVLTGEFTALGVTRLLEAVRTVDLDVRFYQASSSEMFGKAIETPQREATPFHPRSPYGVAKVYGHYITVNYRESYNLFACSGILFNHESPRRGIEFVSRKITQGVAKIKLGRERELRMGNLEARRDWGFAGDFVQAMWQMLQQEQPDDYVIGTGVSHSVAELLEIAFKSVGLEWREFVRIDESLLRPAEVDHLLADTTKATQKLGWKPKVSFAELIAMMVDHDVYRIQRGMPLYASVVAGL
ncbi:MAG TPA: GDP-mannose 4,6-dehydratase [Terriglobales bacterium]|jgi:GDPmannose 4,6-dehydratase|nr:GDP-mannose 4,6-dehydratase [Terriglobales bacterium]